MDAERDPLEIIAEQAGLPLLKVANMNRRQLGELREQAATRHADFLDAVDELAGYTDDEENPPSWLPIILGGATVMRCHRCQRTFTAETWRVQARNADGIALLDTCRYCAASDPELGTWQGFCDIADAIDALMRTAPDKNARRQLKACLENAADHFSVWRWPHEDDTAGPVEVEKPRG